MSEAKPLPLVLIDTREQLPYTFDGWPDPIRKTLATGDYSIAGHEATLAIERKSQTDLLGCLFSERFTRELERLAEIKRAYLVIESSIYQIKNDRFYKGNKAAVIGKLQAIGLRYGVHVLFLDDRETAQNYVKGLLEKYQRILLKGD